MTAPPPPLPAWRRDPTAAANRLDILAAWRRGGRLALFAAPAAAAAGPLTPAAAALAAGWALIVAAIIELAARDALRACVVHPELRTIPAVARERARLCDAAHRRRLAGSVRRTALYHRRSPQERRLSPYPPERLAGARAGLLELADAIEHATHADPAVLVDIEALLRDGIHSPLLNTDIPAPELRAALTRALYRLAADTPTRPTRAPDVARRPRPTAPAGERTT